MKWFLAPVLITCVLSACSYDINETARPPQKTGRAMPDIYQSVTPSQRRAIMSGEQPDWTEMRPNRIPPR